MIAGTTVQIPFLRRLVFAVVATLVGSTPLAAQTLAWNANAETNIAGYRVQHGTTSGSPSTTIDVGRVTSWRIAGLQAGRTYYLRVVAYNTAGQTSTPSAQVTYVVPGTPTTPAPTLTSVSPASGPTAGGTTITLTGTNFVSGATVRVGGVAATSVTFSSSTRLTARTPAGTAGARDVLVTNPNGASTVRVGAFTYTSTSTGTLTATAVTPNTGPPSGGTAITVTGTGFVSGATLLIGGTPATSVSVASSTRITARTPAKPAGGYSVQVRNPNGQTANTPRGFLYSGTSTPPPTSSLTATAVTPNTGPTSGGTAITVTGTGFVSGATLLIGGTPATSVSVASSTRITARTPRKPAGGYSVQVRNPNGQTANTPRGFLYTGSTSVETTAALRTMAAPGEGDAVDAAALDASAQSLDAAAEPLVAQDVAADAGPADDADGDGLPTAWEVRYGLNPASATGDDGAGGDPDADGVTNDAEHAAGSHPRGLVRRYLAEGVESAQMHTRLAIANAESAEARVLLTFMRADGTTTSQPIDVPARSRRTIDLSAVRELASSSFATLLESDREVALDRVVTLDPAGRATTLAAAVDAPASSWRFAAASTVDPAELFYLVQNPGETETRVAIRYLPSDGAPPIERSYTVAAHSRTSIWVDREEPSLAGAEVAAELTSVDGTPIVVERTSYVKTPGSAAPRSGATTAGASTVEAVEDSARDARPRWLLAEGELGGERGATTTLSVTSQTVATDVAVTLLFEDGGEVRSTFAVRPGAATAIPLARAFPTANGRRFAVLVEAVDPAASLAIDRAIAFGTAAAGRRPTTPAR